MKRQTFSQYFNLNKSQHELDFVDIPVNDGDIPLFIDPYAISKRTDRWSRQCHNLIVTFFQNVIDHIRSNRRIRANRMLSGLREPNQTRFGLSIGKRPRGRGIGKEQAASLYWALTESSAVKTGFLRDLEDCELLIEGVSRDKISDIATNIIREKLIEYTQHQCVLFAIPTRQVPSDLIWDNQQNKWSSHYVALPVCHRRSVVLLPKAIARYGLEFSHQEYYQHFVLNFLQAEELRANSSLVRVLKDGTKKEPTKKSLKARYPLSKKYLYEFSKEHPEVLDNYKTTKTYALTEITNEIINATNEREEVFDWDQLKGSLEKLPIGHVGASEFHDHTKGVLTAIFYPFLINPVKEQEIHQGRKRIDLAFENAARDGFFWSLSQIKHVPSAYIFTECKNYLMDPANPELDQLSGRFSVNRGRFGFLVCRKFTNKDLFHQKCRDTAQDDRGFIVALDDSDVTQLLEFRKNNNTDGINTFLDARYRKLVM